MSDDRNRAAPLPAAPAAFANAEAVPNPSGRSPIAAPTFAPLPAAPAEPAAQRLLSLDVYRGLIMISLAFNGFGLAEVARRFLHPERNRSFWSGLVAVAETQQRPDYFPDFWQEVYHHFEHVEWTGCGYWDMIQPSFMFMVGVALAFSYARRVQTGLSYPRLLGQAVVRSLVLIFLGIFLISNNAPATEWSFMNVLTQIGLAYPFLFLMWNRSPRWQLVVAFSLLLLTWGLYETYPYAGIDLARGAPEVGVSQEWAQRYLTNVPAAWHKNANVGHAVDVWLLNLLPRAQPFRFNGGGYQTVNFIPSLATMLLGLVVGELLRSGRPASHKLGLIIGAGLAGIALGEVLDQTVVCPIVKRIWTPAWAVFSTGICCLILAAFYLVNDMLRSRRWAYPLVVVGVNSIAIYCMGMTLRSWGARTWQTHLGPNVFSLGGIVDANYEPMVQMILVGMLFWLACWWMYRNKIFIRI